MHKAKKMLCVLLALCMLLGNIPVAARAATENPAWNVWDFDMEAPGLSEGKMPYVEELEAFMQDTAVSAGTDAPVEATGEPWQMEIQGEWSTEGTESFLEINGESMPALMAEGETTGDEVSGEESEPGVITVLKVGGVDALTNPVGEGWSFDAATATLTLDNANIATQGAVEGIACTGDLTIVLKGINTISNAVITGENGNENAIALGCQGNLTILGEEDSKLTLRTPFSHMGMGGYAIWVVSGNELVIENCTIDANASIVSDGSLKISNSTITQDTLSSRLEDPLVYGVGGTSALVIENSDITVSNALYGLFNFNPQVQITDSSITTVDCYFTMAVDGEGYTVEITGSELDFQGGVYGICLAKSELSISDCPVVKIENDMDDVQEYLDMGGSFDFPPAAICGMAIHMSDCPDVTVNGTFFNLYSGNIVLENSDITAHGGLASIVVEGDMDVYASTLSVSNDQAAQDAFVELMGSTQYPPAAFNVSGVITIRGGSDVTAEGTYFGIYGLNEVCVEESELDIRGGAHAILVQNALRVNGGTVDAEATWTTEDAVAVGMPDTYPICAIAVGNYETGVLELTDVKLDEGVFGVYTHPEIGSMSAVLDENGTPITAVLIRPIDPTELAVTVGGVDALTTTEGEGWSYDVETRTLTLDNASIATVGAVNGIYSEGDLTIVLKGDNTITNTATLDENGNPMEAAFAINCDRNLTIRGEENSKLTVRTAFSFLFTYGAAAYTVGDLTLENCTIDANSSFAAGANLTVNNCTIVQDVPTFKQEDPLAYGLLGSTGLTVEQSDITMRNAVYGMITTAPSAQITSSSIAMDDCYAAFMVDSSEGGIVDITNTNLDVQGGAYGIVLPNSALRIQDCTSFTIENSVDDCREFWEMNGEQLPYAPAALYAPTIIISNCPDMTVSGTLVNMYAMGMYIQNSNMTSHGGVAAIIADSYLEISDSVVSAKNSKESEDLCMELYGGLMLPPAAVAAGQELYIINSEVDAEASYYGIYGVGMVDIQNSDVTASAGGYAIIAQNEISVEASDVEATSTWTAEELEALGMPADMPVGAIAVTNIEEGALVLADAELTEGEFGLYEHPEHGSMLIVLDAEGQVMRHAQIKDTTDAAPAVPEIVAFGSCGTNVEWVLDSEGTLEISGAEEPAVYVLRSAPADQPAVADAGEFRMEDYLDAADAPWAAYADQIIAIIVDELVSNIGSNAFSGCENLETVVIGDSVVTIGDNAFADCTNLEKVVVGESVSQIGEEAFAGCEEVTMTFTGDEPDIAETAFDNTTAVVNYPEENETWTDSTQNNYGDNATVQSHSHRYPTVKVIKATCTEQGYTEYTCSCGHSYKDNFEDMLGHTEEIIPGKDATCTEPGLTAGVKCSVCGEILTAQEELPELGHAYELVAFSWSEDYLTCKAAFACSCGHETTEDCEVTVTTEAATCTKEGLTTYTAAIEVNGEVETSVKTVVISKLDHNFENGACTVCGEADPEASEPTDPSDPEESEPTDPSEPEESEPTDPSDPEESEPTEPSDPEESEPTEPSEPEEPSKPGTGGSIIGNVINKIKDLIGAIVCPKPEKPSEPTEPSVPSEPEETEPTVPSEPVESEPTTPSEPSEPSKPVRPTIPSIKDILEKIFWWIP